jgi:hypothetical protein
MVKFCEHINVFKILDIIVWQYCRNMCMYVCQIHSENVINGATNMAFIFMKFYHTLKNKVHYMKNAWLLRGCADMPFGELVHLFSYMNNFYR